MSDWRGGWSTYGSVAVARVSVNDVVMRVAVSRSACCWVTASLLNTCSRTKVMWFGAVVVSVWWPLVVSVVCVIC